MTGGLGPTKDDITKKTLAEMFGMKLVRNEQVYEMVGKAIGTAWHCVYRAQPGGKLLSPTAARYFRTGMGLHPACGSNGTVKF